VLDPHAQQKQAHLAGGLFTSAYFSVPKGPTPHRNTHVEHRFLHWRARGGKVDREHCGSECGTLILVVACNPPEVPTLHYTPYTFTLKKDILHSLSDPC
jgi:hypothetical protein